MEALFMEYRKEIFGTIICIVVLLVLKYFGAKTIKKVGTISNMDETRTKMIIKYGNGGITTLGILTLVFIWGIEFKDIGVIFSSVFAIIGVALFAQWSILSNVTAGIILFFSFPFRIGDRIKIMDKEIDLPHEVYLVEDIKTFHLHLRRSNGELITYPNNLMLQKAVILASTATESREGIEAL